MKLKSVVFTVALAAAFSAFSDSSVTGAWFATNTTNNADVRYFDRVLDNPVVVENSIKPATVNVTGYSITAYVTNLVVFASTPSSTLTTVSSKDARGAICAAYDGSSETPVNKWYGLKYVETTPSWASLSGTAPVEGHSYKLRMDFAADSQTVTYSVYDLTIGDAAVSDTPLSTKVITSASNLPNLYAFAGMGGCTNIVGEVLIAVVGGNSVVAVDDERGHIIVPESGDQYSDVRDKPDATADNGLANWVNYVLGINGSGAENAKNKPFVMPVQNNAPGELTFKLGGVDVLGQDATGAKVTYAVETIASPGATTAIGTTNYVGPNDPVNVVVPSDSVKYYRIKIKIDPAQ